MVKGKNLDKKLEKELKNRTILVTGGAGSVGTVLVKKILQYPVTQVRIIDIDEHALFQLKRSISDNRIRLLLGNITDKERIEMAGQNVDIVIHAAAIKNIEISEYNPIETIDVNINGTINMIKMAMKNNPKKFLNVSTDKAVNSSTIYGASKLITERITSWAGIHLNPPTKFASVRFGNVIESRGNVFEVWNKELEAKQPLSVTDPEMNRYFFHVEETVDFILNCLPLIDGGEVFVPKMKNYKIKDLAKKISKNYKIIGVRRGEKMNEVLMTDKEMKEAVEKDNMWIIKNHS
jgi:UDP-N-acetylglucosamine 4,6-dehydratase/5-epimerase